jgi:hypothetical protein
VTNEVLNEFEFDEALGIAYHRLDLALGRGGFYTVWYNTKQRLILANATTGAA